jgi:hypothetical protein
MFGTASVLTAPTLMPEPARGRHLEPAEGACLMEAAAWLAGEAWSDHPHCVHPTVAALARLVNDICSPAGREQLQRLLPELIGAHGVDAQIAPTVVLLTLDFTRTRCRLGALNRLARRRAHRRLTALAGGGVRGRWVRLSDPLYRGTRAERAMARALDRLLTATADPPPDHDLHALLHRCIHVSRTLIDSQRENPAERLSTLPAVPARRPAPETGDSGRFARAHRGTRRGCGARIVAPTEISSTVHDAPDAWFNHAAVNRDR